MRKRPRQADMRRATARACARMPESELNALLAATPSRSPMFGAAARELQQRAGGRLT